MTVRCNLFANYIGQAVSTFADLMFVPIYISILGMESYGLIGIFALVRGAVVLLDLGMTVTIGRQMAAYAASENKESKTLDLLRSFELLSLCILLVVCLVGLLSSGIIASQWIQSDVFSGDRLEIIFMMISSVSSIRLLENLYQGAIAGLQHQVWLNFVLSSFAVIRAAGVVIILLWISPTIEAFFLFHGLIALASAATLKSYLRRRLPIPLIKPRFSPEALSSIRGFATGVMATSFLAFVLTQSDKIILSRILPLSLFGEYALATAAANILLVIASPVMQAFYPNFTELYSRQRQAELADSYHLSTQVLVTLVGPAFLLLSIYSYDLLIIWTGDSMLAKNVAPLLTILSAGTALNALVSIPYKMQLASGWSALAAKINFVAVLTLIPGVIWATHHYGALGAAWMWLALNVGYVVVMVHLMHRRLLVKEKWKWYLRDVFGSFFPALVLIVVSYLVFPDELSRVYRFIYLTLVGILAVLSSALCNSHLRQAILQTSLSLLRRK